MTGADFIVIGAGIAGVGVAAELAADGQVLVLEAEAHPGSHATGRSAALFSETYGNAAVRTLTRESRAFFEAPPEGFDGPLLRPRGTLFVASQRTAPLLAQMRADPVVAAGTETLGAGEALRLVPILEPASAVEALLEPGAADIDVHALHQGYLRRLRARGGHLLTDAEVLAIERQDGVWRVRTRGETFQCRWLVNAAGAWADRIGRLAELPALGLVPMRRTVLIAPAPEGLEIARWPMVITADESLYFKPDAGRLLVSPADETACEACDAQPDELDVAVAVDRLEQATTIQVRRVLSRWAGLRTFAPDRTPVAGEDPLADGFFWLAGQGGYGIQTAPALSRLAAELILGRDPPPDLARLAPALSPARLRQG